MKVKLQTRRCACECGETFRVWPPTSPNIFAGESHAMRAFHAGGEQKRLAEKYYRRKLELIDGQRAREIRLKLKGRFVLCSHPSDLTDRPTWRDLGIEPPVEVFD